MPTNRRRLMWLVAASLLVALCGCMSRSVVSLTSVSSESFTWQGKQVRVEIQQDSGGTSRSTSKSNEQVEMVLNGHVIVLTKDNVMLNGIKKEAPDYKSVKIKLQDNQVHIDVDGVRLLPE